MELDEKLKEMKSLSHNKRSLQDMGKTKLTDYLVQISSSKGSVTLREIFPKTSHKPLGRRRLSCPQIQGTVHSKAGV